MSVGRVLTLGLGTPFSAVKYLVTLGLGTGSAPSPPAAGATNYFESLPRAKRKRLEREIKRTLERAKPDSPEYLRALGRSIALEEYQRFRADQARIAETAAAAVRQNAATPAGAAPQHLPTARIRPTIAAPDETSTDIAMILILIAANID